jgi:uncharacterized membrane protein
MTPEITLIHVGAGSLALLSGAVALSVRKGDGPHRVAGTVFFLSMLVMAASAIYLSVIYSKTMFIIGGALVIYMLATAWVAARRKDGQSGVFETGAFLVATAGALIFGLAAAGGAEGPGDGVGVEVYYVFGGVLALAAILDLSVILRGGVAGKQRIARHLWRMCAGMFVATGSFFLGQQQVLPAFVRGSPVLFVFAFAPLAIMVFWLIRIWLTKWYARAQRSS